MKKMLCVIGGILIVCGLLLFLIGGSVQKSLEPNEVKVGYMSGNTFVETDSGRIGGNVEGQKTMGTLKTVGLVASGGGLFILVAGLAVRDGQKEMYY